MDDLMAVQNLVIEIRKMKEIIFQLEQQIIDLRNKMQKEQQAKSEEVQLNEAKNKAKEVTNSLCQFCKLGINHQCTPHCYKRY